MTAVAGGEQDWSTGAAYRLRQHRAFELARRHSKVVLVLRNAIPAICLIGLAATILFTVFDPFRTPELPVAVRTDGITGSKITMQFPKLSGYKKDLRSYDVTATSAVQEVKRPNVMELFSPEARIETEKDKFAWVRAASGIYDSSTEKMRLEGDVALKSDTGYTVRMIDADIDLKAGTMRTSRPVTVDTGTGSIDAQSMEVEDSGKIIYFRGHVVSRFDAVDTTGATR